jgi:hypothetical protein
MFLPKNFIKKEVIVVLRGVDIALITQNTKKETPIYL